MHVSIVERPEMKAAVIRIPRDGHKVREAWKEVTAKLDGHPAVADRHNGFVFIPEWQWQTEVVMLWVGVEVLSFDSLPEGLETLTIPPKKFAKISVQGDRARMWETYNHLSEWFRSGPHNRDESEGSLGYEMNRLDPVNPFEIPADEIDFFEFDIYAPIKETGQTNPQRFPGVVGVEIRHEPARTIIGFEMFMDRHGRQMKPEQEIPRFWENVVSRMKDVTQRKPSYATVGLYEYKPPFGPGQDFNYVAGVEHEPDGTAPLSHGMTERTIPGRDYVVITYRGKASGLGQVWDYFHGVWFPQQAEYEVLDDYEFERHDERYLGPDHPDSMMEMYFPVRKTNEHKKLTDKIVYDEKGGHVLQDLRGVKVHMASFQGADWQGIDLRDAALHHVNFVNSRWEHIYFSNVHVNMTQLGGTVFENIVRPDAPQSRFQEEPGTEGWVNVEPVVFRNSDLSTAIFENCELRDVAIRDCRLEGMSIDGIPVTELLDNYRKQHG